jgi:hypothetical protein
MKATELEGIGLFLAPFFQPLNEMIYRSGI